MEEVDRIIILSLKDIGCDIGEGIESLEQFSNEMVIRSAVRCLRIIQPGFEVSESLPQNMAARFHMGSAIAQACKGLGYNGDVGYQTFLYSNAGDIRRVFMYLIEKLPREVEKPFLDAPEDPLSRLLSDVGKEIRHQMSRKISARETSVPFLSVPLETGILVPGTKMNPKDWREYVVNDVKFLTEQANPEHFLPSAIVLNSKGLLGLNSEKSIGATPTPRARQSNLKCNLASNEETWLTVMDSLLFSEEKKTRLNYTFENIHKANIHASDDRYNVNSNNDEESLAANEDPHQKIRMNIEELNIRIIEQQGILNKVNEDYKRELTNADKKSKEIEFHEKALSLLSRPEESLKKLEDSIIVVSESILSLSNRWESFRKPLMEKYLGAKCKIANRENQNGEDHEKMKQLRGKIDILNKQLVSKRGIIAQLEEEYEKLPKNINRSAYTRRIMEIIGNIKKQKDEIEKILKDMKELQKETNTLNGRLERLYAVTEDTILKNTKKDDFSKQALKLLTTLHSDCSSIGSLVLEIGTINREITDLREQIETESNKNTSANLERITADLEQMKAESKTLTNQIKKLQNISDVQSHPLL